MKKTVFLIVFCLTITCFDSVSASSLNYNLIMDDNAVCHETITYNIEKKTTNSYLKDIINNKIYFDINNTNLYDKKISSYLNNTIVTLHSDYNCNEIVNSKLINKCFTRTYIEKEKTETYFSATSPFYCSNIADNISITFETSINVIDSNALKDGNKYIWDEIDEDLYISMEMGKQNKNADSNSFSYKPIIVILSLTTIAGVIILVVIRKRNNNNSINNFYEEY